MSKENKNENKSKKLDISVWVLFTAAFLIILFFLWYFFIYVKNNEQLQIQKNFRVLTQLGENFKSRYSSYSKVIQSTDMDSVLNGLYKDVISKVRFQDFDDKIEHIKKYFLGLEAVKRSASYANDCVYFWEIDRLISDTIKISGKKPDIVNFRMSKSTFFQPLDRKDVFDEIIIIREDLSGDSGAVNYELYYTTFRGDIEVKNLDSLIADKSGLSSGTIGDVNILGIDYKLFMTRIKLSDNKSYYVGGVISRDKYIKDTRAINFYIALLIVIIFFTFLLSVPLIKLKVMSENQKLKVSDLLLSTVSIVIGTSFVLLIVFSLVNYVHGEYKINISLKNLSDSINTNLINEINNIDYTLERYCDSLISGEQFQSDNNKFYNYYKLIFKLDPKGDQDNIITSRNKQSSKDNYSYRTYFKESGEWNLKGKKLMLDFIISSTSGEQLGVVSIKKGDSVYVITSRFYSVINTILPPGYGFCVIDDKGDVKFHSDANRMLRENFIEETENSPELKGAIYGRLKDLFNVKYLGKNHSCYISPISSLPLYLVTFFDNSYSNSVNLQITSLTILFLFLLLLLFFATVIGARLMIYRKSELKRSLDIFEWLKPANWKLEMYKKVIVSNSVAIILIFISIYVHPVITLFFIFLVIPLQTIAVFYYTNYLVRDTLQKKYFKIQYIPAVFFIICIFYTAYRAHLGFDPFFGTLVLFFVILLLSDWIILKYFNITVSEPNNPKIYYGYLFSWIGLFVIVPVIIFSIIFYNHQAGAVVKHSLFSFANKEANRDYEIDKFYDDLVNQSFYKYKESFKKEGVYYPVEISKKRFSSEFCKMKRDSLSGSLDEILYYLTPNLDEFSSERKSLSKIIPGEYTNESIESSPDKVIIKYKAFKVYNKVNYAPTSYYEGTISKFGFGTTEGFILFILLLSVSFYLVYKSIQFTTERMFGINIKRKQIFEDIFKKHIESGNNLIVQCAGMCDKDLDPYLSQYSFTNVNYDDPQLLDLIENQLETNTISIKNIHSDFKHPEKDLVKFLSIIKLAEKGSVQLVLVTNQGIEKLIEIIKSKRESEEDENLLKSIKKLQSMFESIDRKFNHVYAPVNEINQPGINEYLVSRLNEAQISEKAKPIIHDELIHLGISSDLIKKYTEVLIDYVKKEESESYSITEKIILKIQNLLNAFTQKVHKLAIRLGVSGDLIKKYTEVLILYVEKEKSESRSLTEKIILKVQELATPYYESIWDTCTHEEKLLMIDISDNLLLNDKNKKVIERLINKGLLKKDISVEIINQSFRNFVNTLSEADEEKEYLKVRKAGNWANYRAPIILVLLAIGFFIALQENILSSITSILPVVLGIITVITKISGIFPGSGATKSGATS